MTRASVRSWIRERQPEPPSALAEQLSRVIDDAPDSAFAGGSIAGVAGRLGLAVLGSVVARQSVAYDAALDLLAADAFVTYAFEAAVEEGGDVTGLVRRLLAEVPG